MTGLRFKTATPRALSPNPSQVLAPCLKLVSPSEGYREAFQRYVSDFADHGESFWTDYYGQALQDFSGFLARLAREVQETWWGVLSSEQLVGVSRLRTDLDPYMEANFGHIGFDVAPRHRGRRYAGQILRLTLKKARQRGLSRVLLVCDVANRAARRVIENEGGRLEGEIPSEFTGQQARRYWVDL